ncbi:MAG: hypothetical protein JSW60_02955 [Thermoplasmatales archaeon]|nr:MAG: hypothetical protein JSW60_02955 [Thermoplasmatales archaeon]
MSIVPIAAGVVEVEPNPEPLDIGRVYLRGLCFNLIDMGRKNYGWAIRLRYIEFTPTERTAGFITLKRVAFGDSILAGRMYEPGPLGFFTFVFGIFRGGIEVQ